MEPHGSHAAEKHQRIEDLHQHIGAMRSTPSDLEAEAMNATAKINEWTAIQQRIQDKLTSAPDVITLNVGGTLFQTSNHTLLRVEGSYFHALLGSDVGNSACGPYFVDLDPDCFRHVLKFLRTGKMKVLNGLSNHDRNDVNLAMEYLKLAPRKVALPSHQWGDLGPYMELCSMSKTVKSTERAIDNGAVVRKPLVGMIQFRVHTIGYEGGHLGIGLGATKDLKPTWESYKCRVCYWFTGEVFDSGRLEASLPNIVAGDLVTLRRGRSHVEIQHNTEPPLNIDLDDPTIELFPMVLTRVSRVIVSILG